MVHGELLEGRATPEGTARFAERFASLPGHFRRPDRLTLSSIGMGTRPGDGGRADDLGYRSSVSRALELGSNVFDSALSYRLQQSERSLGAALRRAFAEGLARRDEVLVVTKGGYLTVDPDRVHTRAEAEDYLVTTYVESGLVDVGRLVHGRHSLDPRFLRDQIGRSRRNLGLATLDVYCLEDPELHLIEEGPTEFQRRLRRAIETLESAVADGEIGAYGLATWGGLLIPHTEKGHLSVAEVLEAALDVGGADHHFRALTFPYSVAMGEAMGLPSQLGGSARPVGVLETLEGTGVAVLTSTPLARGRVAHGLPRSLERALAPAHGSVQAALQFARSSPGVTTTLVGMRSPQHVEHNLELVRHPPAPPSLIRELFEQAASR